MSKKHYYEVDMEFRDDEVVEKVRVESRDVDATLARLKRRERIYYGLMGAVLVAAVAFGFQYSSAEDSAIAFQSDSGYIQTAGFTNTSYDNSGYANNAASTGSGGCGGGASAGGGGCCGGGGGGATATPLDLEALSKELKAFYSKSTGTPETDFEAVVSDRGCHTQGDILVNGQVVKSYAYRNGTFEPIN